jgi:hypothetical protein
MILGHKHTATIFGGRRGHRRVHLDHLEAVTAGLGEVSRQGSGIRGRD